MANHPTLQEREGAARLRSVAARAGMTEGWVGSPKSDTCYDATPVAGIVPRRKRMSVCDLAKGIIVSSGRQIRARPTQISVGN